MRALATAGATLDAPGGSDGGRPLHRAAARSEVPMIRALVTGGADPNAPALQGGRTPLHVAAAEGSMSSVQVGEGLHILC